MTFHVWNTTQTRDPLHTSSFVDYINILADKIKSDELEKIAQGVLGTKHEVLFTEC